MNFNRKFTTYDDNAFVQRKAACHLLDFAEKNGFNSEKFNDILELGCGTGVLTSEIVKRYSPQKIILNDIFDTREYIKEPYDNFVLGDIMRIKLPQAETVISSSVFQWIHPFEKLAEKLAVYDNLAFSIYTKGNLKEIDEHFGISLKYHSPQEIDDTLKKYFSNVTFISEEIVLDFSSPIAALKHLQATGVTGFGESSTAKIRSFSQKQLTYVVSYFLCER